MSERTVNIPIKETFYEVNGTTGLVDADFTKSLFKDGVSVSNAITISEVRDGFYLVKFTPDAIASWDIDIVWDDDPSVRYQRNYNVVAAPVTNRLTEYVRRLEITVNSLTRR